MPSVRSPRRRIVDICSMDSCLADWVEQNPISDRTASNGSHERCNARHRRTAAGTSLVLFALYGPGRLQKDHPILPPVVCSSCTVTAICSLDRHVHALLFGAHSVWGTTQTKSKRARAPTSNWLYLPTYCKFANTNTKKSDGDLKAQQPLCHQFGDCQHHSCPA